ncbi:biotin/lipoyl-containing protein [Lapidilactobacillus mulanensis]|uniref:Biotin/lipoyl-containing protein n=1 Tax=Lapidilactobacillus mulanensis TaxID=2485999 RepID=A0ABW4DL34_9LACO|nr:biotin/lipoyl-containing protein [Lapidilactobacillus mulanensis]
MDKLDRIANVFINSSVDELKYKDSELEIVLKRKSRQSLINTNDISVMQETEDQSKSSCETLKKDKNDVIIKANTSGICELNEKLGLKRGVKVNEGVILCNIEVMKNFIDVMSPINGTVKQIFVNNSSVVSEGDKILSLEETIN